MLPNIHTRDRFPSMILAGTLNNLTLAIKMCWFVYCDCVPTWVVSVCAMWPALIWHVSTGQVRSGDGRPPMGHPHGAALWHHGRWWNEATGHPQSAGRRFHLSLGHRKVTTLSVCHTGECIRHLDIPQCVTVRARISSFCGSWKVTVLSVTGSDECI